MLGSAASAVGSAGSSALSAITGAAGEGTAGPGVLQGTTQQGVGIGLGKLLSGVQGVQKSATSGFQRLLGMDDLQFKQFMADNNEAAQRRRERQMKMDQSPPQFYDFGF